QPLLRRQEQVEPGGVRERVRDGLAGNGRPVVLRLAPHIQHGGGAVVEGQAVHALLAASGEPRQVGEAPVGSERLADEGTQIAGGDRAPHQDELDGAQRSMPASVAYRSISASSSSVSAGPFTDAAFASSCATLLAPITTDVIRGSR